MSAKRTRVSPRVRIQEADLATSKPASVNAGFAVGSTPPFADDRTIIFKEATNILYPVMLPSGSALADVSGITARGRPTPGASDVHSSISSRTIRAFNETEKLYPSRSFYLDPDTTMPSSFGGPLSSRFAIKIDITPSAEKVIYRCPQRHIDNAPFPPEFAIEGSGFCYFNFTSKAWDDIGRIDPLTGAPIKIDQAAAAIAASYSSEPYAITSSVYYVGQFIPPNNANTRGNGAEQINAGQALAMGVTKTGTPTTSFFAPAASKYHARSTNVLRMSDFISQPVLLEKVKIDLPIIARRTHSSSSYYNPQTGQFVANDMHCREMDNYVFFLYRQVRNVFPQGLLLEPLARDNKTDVSGSNRYLIASASVCFYNKPTFQAGLFGAGSTKLDKLGTFPFHSPAFSYNFDMNVENGVLPPAFDQRHFTGSISLEIVPEISNGGLGGVSFLPTTMSNTETASQIRARNGWNINYIQHTWPGTAGALPLGNGDSFSSQDYSGKTSGNLAITIPASFKTFFLSSSLANSLTCSYTNIVNVDEYRWTSDILSSASIGFGDTRPESAGSCINPDPRSFKTSFGAYPSRIQSYVISNPNPNRRPSFIGGASLFSDEPARQTPVILLPSDELVLGVDAGIAPFMRDSSSITGSFLKIEAKNSTLTLYCSQIVNGERRANVRSLQTQGEAVHVDEVDTPVLDEFLLETPISNVGSYYAPLATGSFFSGSNERGIQAFFGYPTLLALGFDPDNYKDWYRYPSHVVMTDDRIDPIDPGVFPRFVFRSDKFGQPAHILQSGQNIAANVKRPVLLPGSSIGGTRIESYPVTNVFTGSAALSYNTSLHATSSSPFSD